ncbi:threonylcarbamoyl-AMP synthase [Candidatus Micrarchaeota archaeon CG10_big_fil_rev_8_21_14_0_10_45_29]|nr:MAG: threonylcarbamoyl-AMP synthase [Candidatus Micrarchaeota archaeon CG10_big_fil_rev_8_21_14_0_10_45_29]
MQIVAIPPHGKALSLANALLGMGEVICYPTDTIYGLGADATNAQAVQKVLEIKGSSAQKPLSAIFSGWEMASKYVKIDEGARQMLEKITPGPFTFILPLKKKLAASKNKYLGCRVPDNKFCLQICEKFGKPIISTSANLSGQSPVSNLALLDEEISQKISLAIDGGECEFSQGSTIIDVENKKIIRKGAGLQIAQKWLEKL